MSAQGSRPTFGGEPFRICFVCLGNICRSPIAEAVMWELVRAAGLAAEVEVDSAGTAGWHIGARPDARTVQEAARHGVRITHRGRRFEPADFDAFELVIALDERNRTDLLALAPHGDAQAKVSLLRAFDPAAGSQTEIADPYYGSREDFARAFAEIEASCRGLLAHLLAGPLARVTPVARVVPVQGRPVAP